MNGHSWRIKCGDWVSVGGIGRVFAVKITSGKARSNKQYLIRSSN
ncbi:Uncharacterised protein [Vibrio cholerae]|nr:Uncharacterised protein [Vibrio cholerae]